jgi:mRNA interferase MazF
MDFNPYDVVVVPFPFTDRNTSKRRPAVVLSAAWFNTGIGHSVLAMITSAKHSAWPLDTHISDLSCAGLPSESVIRMKLFTLDHSLVIRKAGSLSATDKAQLDQTLQQLFPPASVGTLHAAPNAAQPSPAP